VEDFTGMTAAKKGWGCGFSRLRVSVLECSRWAGDYDDPMAFVKHEFEGIFSLPFSHTIKNSRKLTDVRLGPMMSAEKMLAVRTEPNNLPS